MRASNEEIRKPVTVRMCPDTIFRRVTAPGQLVERITPAEKLFVLAHLGIPRFAIDNWSLKIGGLVEREISFDFLQLMKFKKTEIQTFHLCAGHPDNPNLPIRRAANVVWGGVLLGDIIKSAELNKNVKFLWAYGLDHGSYMGYDVTSYVKDIPLDIIPIENILLAYELNGKPLPIENGYPLRLVAPEFYGTNQVKWLYRIDLTDQRAQGPFTQQLYNDPVLPADGSPTDATSPVWLAPPESLIVSPAPHAQINNKTIIWGWAWATGGVEAVDISVDDGRNWVRAQLDERVEYSWQRYSFTWNPHADGKYIIAARATDKEGVTQPYVNARNALHRVEVEVLSMDKNIV